MEKTNKYIQALNNGSEIVIINADPDFNSAIFWKDREGFYHSFSKAIGDTERPDYNDNRFIEHIKEMEAEKAQIFIRGYEEW